MTSGEGLGLSVLLTLPVPRVEVTHTSRKWCRVSTRGPFVPLGPIVQQRSKEDLGLPVGGVLDSLQCAVHGRVARSVGDRSTRADAGILIPQGDEARLCWALLNPCVLWSVGFKALTPPPLFSNLSKGVK